MCPGSNAVLLTVSLSWCIFIREVGIYRLSVQVCLFAFSFLNRVQEALSALG